MATKEQVAAFFKFDPSDEPMSTDDQWIIPDREDVVVQVCGHNAFSVNEYLGEDEGSCVRDHGLYADLDRAMRKALEVAGIDPDNDPVPGAAAPSP